MKIVTWNIAGLPKYVNLYGNPKLYANQIIQHLKTQTADIILLQEVFSNSLYKKIKAEFEQKYYIFDYKVKRSYKVFGSGLVTLLLKTNFIIKNSFFHTFKKASGEDKFANKGFLSIGCDNITVMNTHLNADAIFSTKRRCLWVRNKQIGEVYNYYNGVEQDCILGGDFNCEGLSFDGGVKDGIDYIFVRGEKKCKKGVIYTRFSDHPILICEY